MNCARCSYESETFEDEFAPEVSESYESEVWETSPEFGPGEYAGETEYAPEFGHETEGESLGESWETSPETGLAEVLGEQEYSPELYEGENWEWAGESWESSPEYGESELTGEGEYWSPEYAEQESELTHGAPRTITRIPTLADLSAYSRRYVREIIRVGKKLDCADLAIEIWSQFAEKFRVPISFRIFDSAKRTYKKVRRRDFRTVAGFVRYVQQNLGALGLIDQTTEVTGGHRAAVAGDVYLWRFFHAVTGKVHRWGHTQILDHARQNTAGPLRDRITVVQGTLPPDVPEFKTFRGKHFTLERRGMRTMPSGQQEEHIARLVGSGPRRFNGFLGLR